jgi:hypothetical protein
MRKTLTMILCCLSLASLAQVPCRWTVESSRTAPGQFSCYRGETLSLEPTIKEYGVTLTNYTATLWYQTNGMDRTWWQGTNGMFFTPAMDIGASVYIVYIQAVKTNGTSYRANAVIRMLGAPGETPNAIALPVERLDFASIIYTNAPWLLAELDPGIPGAIATAGTNAQAMADSALSNAVLFATTNQTTRIYNPSNASEYIDGAGNKYVVSNFWNMTFSPNFSGGELPSQTNYLFTAANQWYQEGWHGLPMFGGWWTWRISIGGIYYFPGGFYTRDWLPTTNSLVLDPVLVTGATGYAYISHWTTTNLVGTVALESSLTEGLATKVSTNDVTYLATVSKANTAVQPSTLSGYLPLTGGTMSGYGAAITFSDLYATFTYSSSGIAVVSPPFGINALYKYPAGITGTVDANGEFYLATRTWADSVLYPRNNPSNYITLAQVPAESDTAAKALIVIETNRAIQAEALLYPRNNPSNFTTISSVRTMTHTNLSWGAAGTNATYRMSWDVTNGTFKVEEILP